MITLLSPATTLFFWGFVTLIRHKILYTLEQKMCYSHSKTVLYIYNLKLNPNQTSPGHRMPFTTTAAPLPQNTKYEDLFYDTLGLEIALNHIIRCTFQFPIHFNLLISRSMTHLVQQNMSTTLPISYENVLGSWNSSCCHKI